jgi:hypothetical protein
MAFHKSNLGSFGDSVPCDIDGYIPQDGDTLGNFRLDFANSEEREYWEDEGFGEWVASAVAATAEAEQHLEVWRRQNG